MQLLLQLIDIILHIDVHLAAILETYGHWTYVVLSLIVFLETGLVLTPFLPGDSMLFATGALAAVSSLSVWTLFVLLTTAAILGDALNYWVGSRVGRKLFDGRVPYLKQAHLLAAERFFEKHGAKAVVLARFAPILRTMTPFVAGCSRMSYPKFFVYNVVGGTLWVGSMLFGGYLLGNIPVVKENFGMVVIAIIVVSLMPIAVEFFKKRPSTSVAH